MIKQLLGTALLCCIITAFFYCLFYKIACKSNINDFEADSPYIGDYASSIIVFLAISSLTLLIVVYFYITISPKLPKFLNESGFAFAFLQLLAGLFIRLLHKLFFFTISKITKITSYHKLTSSEISWTWLILCFIYGIVFLINKECTIAFTYFVIDISYFFWLDSSCSSIIEKLSSIKKLSKSYWYVIIFIGLTAFIILRYHSKAQIFFAFIGLLIGIILSIIAMQYSLKRHCKKQMTILIAAHFSTILVPQDKKQARKCPFYQTLRAFENYSNSFADCVIQHTQDIINGFSIEYSFCFCVFRTAYEKINSKITPFHSLLFCCSSLA